MSILFIVAHYYSFIYCHFHNSMSGSTSQTYVSSWSRLRVLSIKISFIESGFFKLSILYKYDFNIDIIHWAKNKRKNNQHKKSIIYRIVWGHYLQVEVEKNHLKSISSEIVFFLFMKLHFFQVN